MMMKNKLLELRKKILFSQNIENQNIDNILKWLKQRNKINKMIVSKVPVNALNNWYLKKNGDRKCGRTDRGGNLG